MSKVNMEQAYQQVFHSIMEGNTELRKKVDRLKHKNDKLNEALIHRSLDDLDGFKYMGCNLRQITEAIHFYDSHHRQRLKDLQI